MNNVSSKTLYIIGYIFLVTVIGSVMAITFGNTLLVIMVTINTMLLGIITIHDIYFEKSILTAGVVFNGFGWLYTNYYFIELLFSNSSYNRYDLFLMFLSLISIVFFNIAYYNPFNIVSLISKLFLNISSYKLFNIMLNKKSYETKPGKATHPKRYNYRTIISLTILMFILAVGIELYITTYKVGLTNYFNATRAQRSLIMSRYSIMAFYEEFIIITSLISLYISLKVKSRTAKLLFILSFSIAFLNSIITVSRADFLFLLLPIVCILKHFNKISNKSIIVFALAGMFVFATWKGAIYNLKNYNTLKFSNVSMNSEFNTWIKIGNNVINDFKDNNGYLHGKSYFDTIYNLIIPVTNTEPLSRWYLKKYEYDVYTRGGGRGFSGVLEAYINFSYFGNFIIFTFYGLLYRKLTKLQGKDDKYTIILIIIIATLYKTFRSEAYAFWKTMYWFEILPVFIIFKLSEIRDNQLLEYIKEDFRINSFRSGLILCAYRIINYTHKEFNNFFGKILTKILNSIWDVIKMLLNINCQISYKATIGANIRLLHIGEGVIISSKSVIGNNVTIYHQVTIGINEFLKSENQKIVIGDNCYISAGAKVISCKLGENVKVGPNAVVYKDIDSGSKIFVQEIIK